MLSVSGIITLRNDLPKDRQIFDNRMLTAMIVPLFVEQLLQMVVGIADTLMVSYAGEEVVSGVSLDTMLYTIFIYLFTAIATGGAVVVSQYLGNKDSKNAGFAASQVYMISAAVSLVCMALILPGGTGFLGLLYPRVESGVMRAADIYLKIVAISFPANAVYNAGAALYRSMGKTKTTMIVSAAMNLINVAGNAIGIFVFCAGAAGVAWPTTISWYFAAIVMTILCFRPKEKIVLSWKNILRIPESVRTLLSRLDPQLRSIFLNAFGWDRSFFQLDKASLVRFLGRFGVFMTKIVSRQTFWAHYS